LSVRDQEKPFQDNPDISAGQDSSIKSRLKKLDLSFFLTFIITLAIWFLLSGKFDLFHISLGLISCFIVAFFSGDLLFESPKLKELAVLWPRFIGYIPWLLYQVLRSNFHVMYLVFHPRMMELIDPRIIEFNSRLKGDFSRVTFANSITLTPGTITVNVTIYGEFSVHVIDKHSGESLPGEMEERIAKVFGE
jgi:multicomponent Na+:H+ antiporter subunit E